MRRIVGGLFVVFLFFGTIGALFTDTADESVNHEEQTQTSGTLNAVDEKPVEPVQVEGSVAETKIETAYESIPFETETTFSDQYQNGTTHVITKGQKGERTIAYEVTYENGTETSRVEISNTVTTQPVNQVVAHGTYVQPAPPPPQADSSNCDPNYTPCIPYSSTDLDCGDIRVRVQVIGSDPHNFDGDNDGVGCESYS